MTATAGFVTILADGALAAGEGVDWRLETTWDWAPWVTTCALLAIVALVVRSYAREASPAGFPYRTSLVLLRLTAIGLMLAMLSEALLAGVRTAQPKLVVLVDRSASMATQDYLAEGSLPESIAGAIKVAPSAGATRFELACAALTGGVLGDRAEQYQIEALDTEGRPLDLLASSKSQRDTPEVSQPPWSGETRLGDGILRQLEAAAGPPQQIVLLTDGQNTAGRTLSEAAESARRLGTQVLAIGIGPDAPAPDVELLDLVVDDVVFDDDPVAYQATLRVQAASPQRVTVRLSTSTDQGNGSATDTTSEQQFDVPAGESTHDVTLMHRPTREGALTAKLTATAVQGERNRENNTLARTLEVRKQQIKVLLAAAYPNYEFRFLKSLLDRDSTIESATLLQDSDIDYTATDPTAIGSMPLAERELAAYDAVVLIDFDPNSAPRSLWASLRKHVERTGGGLALVAGPRSLPWAYRQNSDFAALAPCDLATLPDRVPSSTDPYRMAPTPLGLRSPPMQLAETAKENIELWSSLEPLDWWTELGALKPAVQVWATHPTARTNAGAAAPIVVAQYVGAGRVVLQATDSTWRWRRRVGDPLFARYWVQTLRWLARGKLLAAARENRLSTDRAVYELGESARIELVRGAAGASEPTVLVRSAGQADRRVALSPVAGGSGRAVAVLADLPVGEYRVVLTEEGSAKAEPALFRVVPAPGETASQQRDRVALRALAERTGGGYFDLESCEGLAATLPRARPVAVEPLPPIELWNRWWMLLGITGCLTTEWILRKRKAML